MNAEASAPLAWELPDWPAPPCVRALATTRGGGVSEGRYASLNLGDHVGDDPAAVAENRRRLRSAARLPADPVWLAQVHGAEVWNLDRGDPASPVDAVVTRRAGRVCAILTADCLPVLFASDQGDVVGAAHAGWRGLAAGILEAAVRSLDRPAAGLMAWIGPGIGARHYEVGADVREALSGADGSASAAFRANARGRFFADLALIARRRLERLGLTRVYGGGECTYTDANRYFSHRRDGTTGRQAALIWIEPGENG